MSIYRGPLIIGDIPQLDVVVPFFNPIPTNGLNLFLRADSITGLTEGAAISQWNDESGNNNHATQATGSYQPTYRTNVLNGKPVVRFVASDDFLRCPNSVFSGVSNQTTLFIVQKISNTGVTNFSQSTDDGSNRYSTHTPWTDGNIYWDFGNISSNGRLYGAWGGNSSSFYYWTYLAGSGMAIRRNGTQIHTKATSGTFTPGSQTFVLGGFAGVNGISGDFAEVIMYNRRLTPEEIAIVETYLKNKYNL